MRASELLNESMDFSVSELKDYKGTHPKFQGKKIWYPVGQEEDVECWACKGQGWEDFGPEYGKEECRVCDGEGTRNEFVSVGPEFNVSNSNGYEIQRMMGLDPDYSGSLQGEEITTVLRRLIKLKNTDSSAHTRDVSDERGEARAVKGDDGVDRIQRGPRMVDFGRTQEQVNRYLDDMIELLQFAKKNGYGVTWG
jgi:hypothetical protein